MSKADMFRLALNYHYRQPFEELFATEEGRAALGAGNVPAAVAQLVGPIAYGRLVGAARATHSDHVRIVDEFLAAHKQPHGRGRADRRRYGVLTQIAGSNPVPATAKRSRNQWFRDLFRFRVPTRVGDQDG